MKYQKTSRLITVVATAALLAGGAAMAADKAAAPTTPQATPVAANAALGVKLGAYFNDEQKQAARRAFSQKYAKAKECPAGMEKKAKGCASPWDKRYWAVGQSLQPAVAVYPVPEPVAAQLPAPPKGYEYVRVADDILLIASASKLVMDMIENVSS